MQSPTDAIVIGGGLSGLSAAYELEKLGLSYTLIEVKDRLGGSIYTEQHAPGFVVDGGVFAFPYRSSPTLGELDLDDALFPVQAAHHTESRVAFTAGTEMLVRALETRLSHPIIKQMAVTGIGWDESPNWIRVCLENGLALLTRYVIVATPARYTSRILQTIAPDVSGLLQEYHYDDISYLGLGFTAENRPAKAPMSPPNMIFASLYSTDTPLRVPDGGLLIQAAVRIPLAKTTPEALVERIRLGMGWNHPGIQVVRQWGEAAPLTITNPDSGLAHINEHLPEQVALVGNCYRPLTLLERVEDARQRVRQLFV